MRPQRRSGSSSRSCNATVAGVRQRAPGSWVRGPFAGFPGYNHLPWRSNGLGDVLGLNAGNFFYVGRTSMAAPHVSATAAMMLEKDNSLAQSEVEDILESWAAPIAAGSAQVWDPFHVEADGNADPSLVTFSWGDDATGAGLLQVDAAIAATPWSTASERMSGGARRGRSTLLNRCAAAPRVPSRVVPASAVQIDLGQLAGVRSAH